MEQKRISVPSTGILETNQDGALNHGKHISLAGARHLSQTIQRPSTAGPIQDNRNGILVVKNV